MKRSVIVRVSAVALAVLLFFGYLGFTELRVYLLYNINWQAIARVNQVEKRLLDLEARLYEVEDRQRVR